MQRHHGPRPTTRERHARCHRHTTFAHTTQLPIEPADAEPRLSRKPQRKRHRVATPVALNGGVHCPISALNVGQSHAQPQIHTHQLITLDPAHPLQHFVRHQRSLPPFRSPACMHARSSVEVRCTIQVELYLPWGEPKPTPPLCRL